MQALRSLVCLAVLAGPISATAQITITSANVPPFGTIYADWETGSITFDPGPAGGNRTWDITSYSYYEASPQAWVSPSSTPYGSQFPAATMCVAEGDPGDRSFDYFRIESNGAFLEGQVIEDPDTTMILIPSAPVMFMPLPLTFGAQWSSVLVVDVEVQPGITAQLRDSSRHHVDAWGTLSTPYWNQPVLRDYIHHTTTIYVNGFPVDAEESWAYTFMAQTAGQQVYFDCDSECGPNFTNGDLNINVSMGVAADPARGPVAENFSVGQNYPNPFNPSTMLPVELKRASKVTVAVYNEVGQLIEQQSHDLTAGRHELPIDGSAWSSGSYFATVMADHAAQTTRMVLIK